MSKLGDPTQGLGPESRRANDRGVDRARCRRVPWRGHSHPSASADAGSVLGPRRGSKFPCSLRAPCERRQAWICCNYADLLRQHNAPGDTARAAALLDEALALAQQMGMRRAAERMRAQRIGFPMRNRQACATSRPA